MSMTLDPNHVLIHADEAHVVGKIIPTTRQMQRMARVSLSSPGLP